MKCKLCDESTNFGKSHIIPKSFFAPLRQENKAPLLLTDTKGEFPKKRPAGEYDSEILCKECEKTFDAWDSYGKELLIDQFENFERIEHGEGEFFYKVAKYDYKKIKLFLVSILWRASVSKRKFYEKVNLGPYEAIAKKMILKNDPMEPTVFPAVFAKYEHPLAGGMLEPCIIKMEGVNYYQLNLLDYSIHIKVDKRNGPVSLQNLAIKPEGPLYVIGRDFTESKDFKIMHTIVNKN